jgi:DNA excision repair protein ERCC-3
MPAPDPRNPLIVQSDHTILVEVDNVRYGEARDRLVRFAELVKSPEYIHTCRLTPLSIWNACAAGMTAAAISDSLTGLAKYPVPEHVLASVRDFAGRYGRVKMTRDSRGLVLSTNDLPLAEEIERQKAVVPFLRERFEPRQFLVDPADRGRLKQALVRIGFPAEDLAGYTAGEGLPNHGHPASPAAPGPDGDPGARGRARR